MTYDEWLTFEGCCGHQHVPENDHGDPGALDIARLLIGDDDMTPEQLAAMMGPLDRCKAIEGVVHIHLFESDGSDAGWWALSDVLEFNHRHAKAADDKT